MKRRGEMRREAKGINLKSCDRSTQDLSKFTSQADVIILATGQKDLISPDMVKKGVIIIDDRLYR